MTLNVGRAVIPTSTDQPVIQYNGLDLVQGIGYVQFYGAKAASMAAIEDASYAIMLPTQIYSDSISDMHPSITTGNAWIKNASYAFYTNEFRQAAILDGEILCSIPVAVSGTNPIGEGYRVRPEVRFFKILSDGSSEALTNSLSGAAVYSPSTTWVSKMCMVTIPVTNKIIKPNERIRMNITIWVKSNDAATESVTSFLAFDPQNRTNVSTGPGWTGGSSGSTTLSINFPIKIDR